MDFVDSHGHRADFLGRSDYFGSYHSETYGLESLTKQVEREKVLAFILSYHPKLHECVRLLSLPGLDWTFERMLLGERPASHFVGLEHSYSAFMRSRRAIPGISKSWGIVNGKGEYTEDNAALSDRHFRFGNGDYVYSRRSSRENGRCRTTRANRLLYMKADTYMTMLASDLSATMEQKKHFNSKFYMRSAVWLDFTSQFCRSVQSCLEWLPLCMEAESGYPKPVVITTMNARDGVTGIHARIDRMLACQPALVYRKHWSYTGKNGTPMLTLCGELT